VSKDLQNPTGKAFRGSRWFQELPEKGIGGFWKTNGMSMEVTTVTS